ncbi:MAG: hypothetical protein UT84_C0024G0016, partial [Candidatus Curtissbacteria bacterium GW2011_GWA1_40_16]
GLDSFYLKETRNTFGHVKSNFASVFDTSTDEF